MKRYALLIVVLVIAGGLVLVGLARSRAKESDVRERQARDAALRRAQVMLPAGDIGAVDFSTNPRDPRPFPVDTPLVCRFEPDDLSGTTPKFDCELEDGTDIKVKYTRNPEIPAEVATTRLLAGLGFGADHVSLVRNLRCYGCPTWSFPVRRVAGMVGLRPLFERAPEDSYVDYEWVAVERKLDAQEIETDEVEGWAWFELAHVDPAQGGATRAELDALRLVAVLLNHWDNKSSNQRLVCPSKPRDAEDEEVDAPCDRPLAIIQDTGATFGPTKVDYTAWSESPVWMDAETCTVSLRHMPYRGGTFTDTRISEAGRRLATERLTALSREQVRTLFEAARFPDARTGEYPARDVSPWVETFLARVRAIADHPGCPE